MKKTLFVALMVIAGFAHAECESIGPTMARYYITTADAGVGGIGNIASRAITQLTECLGHNTGSLAGISDEKINKTISFYQKALDDKKAEEDKQAKEWKAYEEKQAKQQAAWKAEAARLAALPGVRIGMSADAVLTKSSWGKPASVNRTTTAAGTREQWVYGSSNYLYFTNGVLTAIQN